MRPPSRDPTGSAVLYCFAGCSLDLRRGCLFDAAERQVELRPKSFDVLRYLVENAGRLVTKEELIASVWQQAVVSDESISRCIGDVRTAIGDRDHKVIKTVPRRGYLLAAVVTRQALQEPDGFASAAPRTIPDKPSVAVLAFANMSGDPAQDYVSDGITDDVITELSRFAELFVIARNSSFKYKGKAVDIRQVGQELGVRYILEGSFRRTESRVRITAQLIDAATGAHRWAERYDREFTDVFAVQDDVVRAVATILAAHVRNAEAERTALKPPATWQAYDYYLRAARALTSFWTSYRVDEFWEARRLAERAVLIDPGYARGHALLASTYVVAWLNCFGAADPSDSSALDRGLGLAAKAVQLDANLPQARAQLGNVLSWQGQHEAALTEFERAAELNPNFVEWRYAIALILAGQTVRALEVVRNYIRMDPFAAGSSYLWLGAAHYLLKDYSQALVVLRDCVFRMPNARFIHAWLAATYAQLDDLAHAQFHAAEVLRIEPRYTIRGMNRTLSALKSVADAEHLVDGLMKAGLPEG